MERKGWAFCAVAQEMRHILHLTTGYPALQYLASSGLIRPTSKTSARLAPRQDNATAQPQVSRAKVF